MLRPRAILVLIFCPHSLFGGVVLDGSFGTHGTLPGPNYLISANFGKQVGTNLFQSFSQFNLINSESATFTGPSNIQNILARVTSGSPSSIDGTIRSDILGANLFFMNPAGVLFGQHAQLDVSGSFAVTTANYLKLVGGGRFNASLGGGDVLTSAPVSAFGFLDSAPGSVSVMGSTLSVAPQKVFSAIAGDITISGGQVTGEGSRVNLVSVRSPGETHLNPSGISSAVDVSQFTSMGDIEVSNATLDLSGPAGGPVVIRAGTLQISTGSIASRTTGSAIGGDIDLLLTGSLQLDNGSIATVTSGDSGKAGNVIVHAGTLKIVDGGIIFSNTDAGGTGGDVKVTSDSLRIDGENSVILTDTLGRGNAGSITVQTGSLTITGGGGIAAETESDGHGGEARVAADSLLIDGVNSGIFADASGIASARGNAGSIIVQAGSLTLTGGGGIAAETLDAGNAGDVRVTAKSLLADGEGSGIFADTSGSGNAGSIIVQAGSLTLTAGGGIDVEVVVSSGGNGGNVSVTANSLLIDGVDSGIFADTSSSGNAGSITVQTGSLTIKGGTIAAASFSPGTGEGGSISINTNGPINLNHGAGISTSSDLSDAGSIDITSRGKIELSDQSYISVSAAHNGGDIHITTPELVYLINSSITATAAGSGGSGSGGNITIDPIFIVLNNSLISANAAAGQGGNINLISGFFFDSNSLITATGTTNGTVKITAPSLGLGAQLVTLPSSLVSAENQLRERCTALLQGDFSSFISIGRGGTEPEPDELESEF